MRKTSPQRPQLLEAVRLQEGSGEELAVLLVRRPAVHAGESVDLAQALLLELLQGRMQEPTGGPSVGGTVGTQAEEQHRFGGQMREHEVAKARQVGHRGVVDHPGDARAGCPRRGGRASPGGCGAVIVGGL